MWRDNWGSVLMPALIMCMFLSPSPSQACGPYFPNRLLIGNDQGVLWSPMTTFSLQLRKVLPPTAPIFKARPTGPLTYPYVANKYQKDAMIADLFDLESALRTSRPPAESYRIYWKYFWARDELYRSICFARVRELFPNPPTRLALVCRYFQTQGGPRQACTPPMKGLNNQEHRNLYDEMGKIARMDEYLRLNCPDLDISTPPNPDRELDPDTPTEFVYYFNSAKLYYRGQWPDAREFWLAIMDLPQEQRRYKSTWAAFMIGKTLFEFDRQQSVAWFRLVRDLAAEGYHDNLGLAAESYLWEAKAAYDDKNYIEAIRLFITARSCGYDDGKAYLRRCASAIVAGGPEAMKQAAHNRTARQVVSAYFASFFNSYRSPMSPAVMEWLQAVESSGHRDLLSADLLAWTAYQNGQMDLCRHWLNLGSNDTGLSLWLRAKLQIRDGQIWESQRLLKRAATKFAESECWDGSIVGCQFACGENYQYCIRGLFDTTTNPSKRIYGELGTVQLKLGLWTEALDSFFGAASYDQWSNWRTDYGLDALYVAERVMTVDELQRYIDLKWPESGPIIHLEDRIYGPRINADPHAGYAQAIRYILARRLTRLQRFSEARPYFPWRLRFLLDDYVNAIERGNDSNLSAAGRAAAFWEAGDIARHHGRELMEIEIETDWMRIERKYELDKTSRVRLPPSPGQRLGATAAERRRVQQHLNEAGYHFHYYYEALGHYLSAVALMPDEDDETARRICLAGRWMRYYDPRAADIFYKSLVWRCWSTALGRKADEKRWFPECGAEPGTEGAKP